VLNGRSTHPLEAYSILLEHFVAAPIMLLDRSVEHSRSASSLHQVHLFMNKSDLSCFGLSIILLILHMVEVCSITVSLVYCCNTH
jgi:hypothetical protein